MTLIAGATVGRYQILEPLGQGGMATVYKAYQPSLQREVALKVLRPGYAQDAEFRERFEREAIAIAKLRHPHIVQVFDFEIAESGEYVLAMEFLEGGTLKDRLTSLAAQGRGMDPRESVRIVSEVAEALGYAHEKGIVHRDVKPSNVMLTRKDWAVVTDFGIARILGATSHTQTGVGIGTPEYMAPEQGQGGAIDHRADIYSLGAMAYELVVGRVPYVADTPLAVVLAHMKDPLPLPSTVNPTVGKNVERVLLEALAKSPDQRFGSATDFADALRGALTQDAMGGTLPTIAVRTGTGARAVRATAQPATLTTTLPAVLRQRPLLSAGVAAVLLLSLGGGAAVLGVFGRAGTVAAPTPTEQAFAAMSPPASAPTLTPTASPTPTATPTATPAPPTAPPVVVVATTPPPTAPPCGTIGDPAATGFDGSVLWGAQGAPGVRVELSDAAGRSQGSGMTDGSGYFRITGVTPGINVRVALQQGSGYDYQEYGGFQTCTNRITRVEGIQIYRLITGLSPTAADVPPGTRVLTWDAVPSASFYCVRESFDGGYGGQFLTQSGTCATGFQTRSAPNFITSDWKAGADVNVTIYAIGGGKQLAHLPGGHASFHAR